MVTRGPCPFSPLCFYYSLVCPSFTVLPVYWQSLESQDPITGSCALHILGTARCTQHVACRNSMEGSFGALPTHRCEATVFLPFTLTHSCSCGSPGRCVSALLTRFPSCRLPGHEGVPEGLLSHQTQQQALQARARRKEHPSQADGRREAGAEAADRHQAHQVGQQDHQLCRFG